MFYFVMSWPAHTECRCFCFRCVFCALFLPDADTGAVGAASEVKSGANSSRVVDEKDPNLRDRGT